MQTFEKKYNGMILRKIDRLETVINDMAFDQARQTKEQEYIDGGLFPQGVTAADLGTEKMFRDTYRD